MRITMLENEYWWGGIVNLGETLPYDKDSDCELDLGTIKLALDQSAPLFVSSKGRYIWSDKPFRIRFWHGEIRIRSDYPVELNSDGKNLGDACLNAARDKYTLPSRVPDRLFFEKPQYNTWIELNVNSSQEKVLEYAENIISHGMPAGILMIDAGWQICFGNWEFRKDTFPEPEKMIKRLHELGFTVMLWTMAVVDPEAPDYEKLKAQKLLLQDADGNTADRWWWAGRTALLDLSNPSAVQWYKSQLDYLQEKYGVDGFKFDGGDAYFFDEDDASFIKGCEQDQIAYYEELGKLYPFHEFRCGWKGGGKPYVHRLQDKMHTWEGEGLNQIIPHSLLQGLTGNFYHCPDMLGGGVFNDLFETSFDEELFIRWTQASALCPMIQFSLAPWRVLSQEGFRIVERMYRLHQEMAPFILELAGKAAASGEPIMRPMAYEFPEEGMERILDQYMLGSRVMAAPVMRKGAVSREVVLPGGMWKAEDGTLYEGGRTIHVEAGLERLPYFIKIG